MLQQILCHRVISLLWCVGQFGHPICARHDANQGVFSMGWPENNLAEAPFFSSWYFKQGEKIDRKHGNAHTHQWILMVFYGENISRFPLQRTHWPLAEELCETRVSRRAWHAEAGTRRRSMISQDDWSAHQMSKVWVTWWLVRSCWLRARKQSGHL